MKKLSEIKENVLFQHCGQARIKEAIKLCNSLTCDSIYAGKRGLYYGVINNEITCYNKEQLSMASNYYTIKHISVDQFINLFSESEQSPEPNNLEVIFMIYNKEVARTDFENLKDYHKFLRENEGGIVIIQKKESEFEKFNKIISDLDFHIHDYYKKEFYDTCKNFFQK